MGIATGELARLARKEAKPIGRSTVTAPFDFHHRSMSSVLVISTQVQPVSLHTRWSLVPGSARL